LELIAAVTAVDGAAAATAGLIYLIPLFAHAAVVHAVAVGWENANRATQGNVI